MFTSQALIRSPKASAYLIRLCKHFAHKVPSEWDETKGRTDFGMGTCDMQVGEEGGTLALFCASESEEGLARVKFIVEDHVVRFGWKEELKVPWEDGQVGA